MIRVSHVTAGSSLDFIERMNRALADIAQKDGELVDVKYVDLIPQGKFWHEYSALILWSPPPYAKYVEHGDASGVTDRS